MAIELPSENFTDQGDIVPMSGVDSVWNYGATYTLGGNDLITGTYSYYDPDIGFIGFLNANGAIDTGIGSDMIVGSGPILDDNWYGYNMYNISGPYGIYNGGAIETSDGEDVLVSYEDFYNSGTVSLGNGNDQLFAVLSLETAAAENRSALKNNGTIEAGDGNDYLSSIGTFYNPGMVSLGDGNDTLVATNIAEGANFNQVLLNNGNIESGNGDDFLISYGGFYNSGTVSLGNGNDSIKTQGYYGNNTAGLGNSQTIETGEGDDIILSTGNLYNQGVINTGNGKDSLSAYGNFEGSSGYVFLGNGEDYLSGFGSGYYEGGNDQDTMALTSGSYTIGISGGVVSFIKNGYTMATSGFEKLIANGQTYDFISLTDQLEIDVY